MRQVLVIAAFAAVVLLIASPAGASSTKGPTLKSLAAQVKSLQKQVTTLKKRATANENAVLFTLEYAVCSTAVAADTFQDTFTGLDSYFVARSQPAYFGAQSAVDDYKACQDFKVVRAHNQSPPNTNILRALLDLFSPSSFATNQAGMNFAGQPRDLFGQLVLPR